jgi:membrane-bound ClpP family serine protease
MRLRNAVALFVFSALFSSISSYGDVLKIVVSDTIQAATAERVERAIDEASARKCEAVLIEFNTPGGVMGSMQEIMQKIIASPVPVIIYVTPSGSRAASAGFFILESADVAAMAPGTHTGAAHPVGPFGGEIKGPYASQSRLPKLRRSRRNSSTMLLPTSRTSFGKSPGSRLSGSMARVSR